MTHTSNSLPLPMQSQNCERPPHILSGYWDQESRITGHFVGVLSGKCRLLVVTELKGRREHNRGDSRHPQKSLASIVILSGLIMSMISKRNETYERGNALPSSSCSYRYSMTISLRFLGLFPGCSSITSFSTSCTHRCAQLRCYDAVDAPSPPPLCALSPNVLVTFDIVIVKSLRPNTDRQTSGKVHMQMSPPFIYARRFSFNGILRDISRFSKGLVKEGGGGGTVTK